MFKKVVTLLVCVSMLMVNVGCFGSFKLTQKLYNWNDSLGNKWGESALLWVLNIIPVYPLCAFVDIVIFNLIEFWAGNNPLAVNSEKETEKTFTSGDKVYNVTFGNGSIVIHETVGPDAGKSVALSLDKETSAWYLSDGNTSTMVASYNPAPLNTVDLYHADGRVESQGLGTVEKLAVK